MRTCQTFGGKNRLGSGSVRVIDKTGISSIDDVNITQTIQIEHLFRSHRREILMSNLSWLLILAQTHTRPYFDGAKVHAKHNPPNKLEFKGVRITAEERRLIALSWPRIFQRIIEHNNNRPLKIQIGVGARVRGCVVQATFFSYCSRYL